MALLSRFRSTIFVMERLQDVNGSQGAPSEVTSLGISPFPLPRVGSGPTEETLDEGPPMLHVHLVYEDLRTGARATKLVERLGEDLKLEADFRLTLTLFDNFREPQLGDLIAAEAEDADILLLSAHGRRELPGAVISWVQEWLKKESVGPRALVLSFDAEAEGTAWASQFVGHLQGSARLASVEVFPHFGRGAIQEGEYSLEDIQYRAETRTALLDEALYRIKPSSHWGINE